MEIKLSIIIIAKDESKMIGDCLKSISWADEILVIDNGSQDKTVDIARKHSARVANYPEGKTFSERRNKGLHEAKGKFVLYLDADERITPELRDEIEEKMNEDWEGIAGYAIPRKNIILGRELKHGGWYPDYVKRFFLKSKLEGWTGKLHEEPKYKGQLLHLNNAMLHIKHETFAEMVEKTNKWSEIEGRLMYEAHHPKMNIKRFLSAMWREFWYRMVVKMAFLDGAIGIMFAMYQVFSRFISYTKLWELQIKNEKGSNS